jgi:hypothetical protein
MNKGDTVTKRGRFIPGLLLAAALLAVPAASVPAASASTSTAAKPAGVVIFAPCTAFEDGRYIVVGHNVYECIHIKGLGWYWVRWTPNSCPGAVRAAREAARLCR